jgi:hypothetical protein
MAVGDVISISTGIKRELVRSVGCDQKGNCWDFLEGER